MKRIWNTRAFPFLLAAAFSLPGCDWIANHFFNSVSIESQVGKAGLPAEPMRVYIGVDGLSHDMVKAVLEGDDRFTFEQNAWSSSSIKRLSNFRPSIAWSLAASVSMFPASSDSCWTRMMRAKPLEGHEFAFYDPNLDAVVNAGVPGLAKHVVPTFADTISIEADYFKAFDVQANGYLHRLTVYQNQFNSFAETLDQIFYVLEGRLRNENVFSAYIAEIDAVGHMLASENADLLVRLLLKRIEEFRANHPEREIHFTLFSDHGMDFSPMPDDGIERRVELVNILSDVGVRSVTRLRGEKPDPRRPFALALGHTRVNYEAAYTHPALVAEVARRITLAPSVDLVVGRMPACPPGIDGPSECHGIWAEGAKLLSFGHRASDDAYLIRLEAPGALVAERLDLPAEGDWTPIVSGDAGEAFVLSDEAAFNGTISRSYPDLFHRIRSGLEAQHILYPPQILVSYARGFVSKGFSLPFGSDDVASYGFHGSLLSQGSIGVMMTTEKTLPAAVRADQLMDLFPELARHAKERLKER